MEFGERIIPIDENTEDEILEVFNEYTFYTRDHLKDSYNYVWFEITDRSKFRSITFTRKYTNYYNDREKVIIEKMFEAEREHLKRWFHTLKVQIKYNNLIVDSIRINVYGNGFSYQAGINEKFIKENQLDNLIEYLKKNPEKMYFEEKFYFDDKNGNVRIIEGKLLKDIMFRLMNIREK